MRGSNPTSPCSTRWSQTLRTMVRSTFFPSYPQLCSSLYIPISWQRRENLKASPPKPCPLQISGFADGGAAAASRLRGCAGQEECESIKGPGLGFRVLGLSKIAALSCVPCHSNRVMDPHGNSNRFMNFYKLLPKPSISQWKPT